MAETEPYGIRSVPREPQSAEPRQSAGFSSPRISINVSSHQFRHRDMVRQIQAAISRNGIPAGSLCVELTESAIMQHAQENVGTLASLRNSGVALSIDDFGTGYSSLNYLKRFPIDEIKIDRSFVADIVHDRDSFEIVTAVLALAHSLRLRVVAEGVETAAQLELLVGRGCDECQGYLFSRPLPLADFSKLLLAGQLPTLPAPL